MKTKRLMRWHCKAFCALLGPIAICWILLGTRAAHGQDLFVSNAMSVTVYSRVANGNMRPVRTPDDRGLFSKGLAVDTVNNELVYVLLSTDFVPGTKTSEVLVFDRTVDGKTPAPIRNIGGAAAGLDDSAGLAVDTVNDEVFVTNPGNIPLTVPVPRVVVFNRTANGDVAPLRTLVGAATGLNDPEGVVVDTVHNEIMVVNTAAGTVTVYDRTANGDTAPIRTLVTTAATGGALPTALALDLVNDELVVANGDFTVTVYSRAASGTALPIRTLNLNFGSLPSALAVDAVNNELFVALQGGAAGAGAVTVYSRTASGSDAPLRVLAGSHTGLSGPHYIAVTTSPPPRIGNTTIGLYRPNDNLFFLRNSNTSGLPTGSLSMGDPGDLPFVGDWNGDGTTDFGVFRPGTNTFYLTWSPSYGPAIRVSLGIAGDLPVVGDWDGDGTTTVGLFRPSSNTFYTWNSNSNLGALPDSAVSVGAFGDVPLAGDWDGDGTTTVGLFRPGTNTFYLWNSPTTGGVPDVIIALGAPGDLPIVGDWDGNGTTTVGLYRPSNNTFYLWNDPTTGALPDLTIPFGAPGDLPVAGNWEGL